jgi:hypothetical protein
MKNPTIYSALAAILTFSSMCHGGEIYFGGDGWKPQVSTGTLQILFDTAPENYTFRDGGIWLELSHTDPGVIEFTGATVINDGRWILTGVQDLSANRIGGLQGVSVHTPGLPNGPAIVFAEVTYRVLGIPLQSSRLKLRVLEDGLFAGDAPPYGADVSSSFMIRQGEIRVSWVPEPATPLLMLAGVAMLLTRRTRVEG